MTGTPVGNKGVAIERLDVSAYTMPTDFPGPDGTYSWDKTTIVIVEATAGGRHGLGYTYADLATAQLIQELLANVVQGALQPDLSRPGLGLEFKRADAAHYAV